jgi:hypothetical protein
MLSRILSELNYALNLTSSGNSSGFGVSALSIDNVGTAAIDASITLDVDISKLTNNALHPDDIAQLIDGMSFVVESSQGRIATINTTSYFNGSTNRFGVPR